LSVRNRTEVSNRYKHRENTQNSSKQEIVPYKSPKKVSFVRNRAENLIDESRAEDIIKIDIFLKEKKDKQSQEYARNYKSNDHFACI